MLKTFPAERFRNSKILVVEDMELNLKVICAKLTASGYTNIESAMDGIEGIEATHRIKPDLVLLDLMMPRLDGFGYMDKIRADKTIWHMPIIVQTALKERETKIRALSCGADDFLNKPLDLEEVALRVYIHLERFFILQDLQTLRGKLHAELEQANETITQLESRLTESDRELITRHHEAIKNITGQTNGSANDVSLFNIPAIRSVNPSAPS